jgi:hypothetical protein
VIRLHQRMPCHALSWLMFTFAAPMLWSLSTHIDTYLVDPHFPCGSVRVLLSFTADTGLLFASVIWSSAWTQLLCCYRAGADRPRGGFFTGGCSSFPEELRTDRGLRRHALVSNGLI